MTPSLNQRSAARILDLADPAARPRRPRALAAGALFFVISAFCAHGFVLRGSPDAARAAEMSPAGATNAHAESPEMKQLLSRLSVASAVAVGSSALAQDAVQWRVEDGGNGHWYRVAAPFPNLSWDEANAMTLAVGGHAVTFGDIAETNFVVALVQASLATLCPLGPWIGLVQDSTSPNYAEPSGGWLWLDGTKATINWALPSSPNNDCFGSSENNANMTFEGEVNDLAADPTCVGFWPNGAINSVVIEWSADCNADGVVDYGQIRAGELEDTNANNIPDCCEAGTTCACAADISGNGTVDAVDLAAVLSSWGNAPTGKTNADINRDGEIDAIDLAEVLGAWGACP